MRDWLPKSRVQHRIVLRSSRACSGASSRDAAALEHFGYRNGRTTNLSSIDSELYVVDVDGHCSMGQEQDGGEKQEVGILGMFSHRETSFRMRRRITESSNIDCYRYHFHTPTHHTSLSTCSAPPSSALRESPHNLVPALLQSLAQLFAAPSSHPESPAQRPESLRYGVMPAHRDLDKRRLLAVSWTF